MSRSATDRYRLRPAPPGLALVQDLLNSRAIQQYGADLLANRDDAEAWANQAAARWAHDRGATPVRISLPAADLRALRDLRASLDHLVAGSATAEVEPTPTPTPTPATLTPARDGTVRLTPTGTGWRWLASALWIETFRAQQDGTWARLKLCRNPGCRSAFYDSSRNNSGVWHDVRTCGNVANLRAARERKRTHDT